ncbi:protein nessun dorma-like [Ochlerotatus camptorhynchus]|uniref:protein nessun dorma-like n=1 Tax=Ochlerotatus camptorhynchus TaxID=644619 RepID=UPI0031D9C17D
MEVFEFKKSLLVRQQEALQVLGARDVPMPASTVRKEWALFLEIAMEPTGWQALWRIPRLVCQELSTKFPTVVMGTVEKVLFDDLKAILVVEAVENDDFHLPEKQIIPLCDLWPLKHQRIELLNIDRTADCIDQLRFFYQHVWMPWDYDDDDEDRDWPKKHLESRIKFYCDLKNKTMPKRLTCHVLTLLDEANQLQKKRELLELETEDEDGTDPTENNSASDLLKIHLRLNSIKNVIETLEFFAPEMRTIYEQVCFPKETYYSEDHPQDPSACIITHVGSLDDQIEYLEITKKTIGHQKLVRICDSLQEALDRSRASDDIYLPPGQHEVKLFEDLNGDGSIQAIGSDQTQTVIRCRQDDTVLLTLAGDYRLENITLDCSNVQTGILVKRGNITFKNCCFTGDPKDIANHGILVCGNGTIRLEHCVVENFSFGICANSRCNVQLHNSTVRDCFEGIKIVDGCRLEISSSAVVNCRNYGTILEMDDDDDDEKDESAGETEAVQCYQDYRQLREWKEFVFEGACQFQNNGNGNFVVFRNDVGQ